MPIMHRVNPSKRAQVIPALVEGNSIRATVRITGVPKNAIQRLIAALRPAREEYQNRALRVTPGMETVIADHVWSIEEIVGLLDSTNSREVAA